MTVAPPAGLRFDNLPPELRSGPVAALSRQVAEDAPAAPDTLLICGDAASGKSHLLAAIANLAGDVSPEMQVRFYALREWSAAAEGSELPSENGGGGMAGDLLLADDLQALAGNPVSQLELIRALYAAERTGARVVVTTERAPAELGLDARIGERLAAARVVRLTPATGAGADGARPQTSGADDEFAAFFADIAESVAEFVETHPEAPAPPLTAAPTVDRWFYDAEKLLLDEVASDQRIVEELG